MKCLFVVVVFVELVELVGNSRKDKECDALCRVFHKSINPQTKLNL
jgi:hypothetical protein